MSIVRTAYAFSPTSISNCALWLDGSKESGTDGSTLTTITDRTNSGNSLTASGTISIASSYLGGLTVYNFGNSRAYANNFPWQTSFTQIVLVKCSLGNWLSSLWGSSTYQAYVYSGNWNLEYIPSFGANDSVISQGTSVFTSTAGGTTAWTIFSLGYQSGATTASNYSLNGTVRTSQTGTASSVTLPTNAQLWLNGNGNGSFDTSYVAELIHYNTVLTDSQRQQVEGYLAQKWGLTSSLSTGHPGLTSRIYRSDYLVPNKVKPVPYYTKFSPRQIAGCSLWLDGTDPAGNGVVPSAGTLATWVDKSGSGNNATQTTGGNRPTYSNNGLVFSGSQWYQTSITSFPTAESIFIVFRTTTGIADIFAGTTGSSREVLLYTGNKIFLGSYGTDPSSTTPNSGVISLNTNILYSVQYTSSAITFNVNGSTTGSGSPPFTFSGTGTSWIGSSGYAPNNMNGTIYEFIYYNSSLSSTLRQQVESYLAQKWGLTASLPGDHLHLTQQAGAVTTVAKTKFTVTGLPRITFASTGLAITHQDGRVWKVSSTAIGLNTGTAMSLTIYAGSDVFNSAGGRVALFDGGSSANAVRHAGYVMWANAFSANNYDFGWKFVSSGSGYLIYNDYPSYSSWQVSYDSGSDRVLIVAPGDGRYGLVWNVTPKVTLAYVYSSY